MKEAQMLCAWLSFTLLSAVGLSSSLMDLSEDVRLYWIFPFLRLLDWASLFRTNHQLNDMKGRLKITQYSNQNELKDAMLKYLNMQGYHSSQLPCLCTSKGAFLIGLQMTNSSPLYSGQLLITSKLIRLDGQGSLSLDKPRNDNGGGLIRYTSNNGEHLVYHPRMKRIGPVQLEHANDAWVMRLITDNRAVIERSGQLLFVSIEKAQIKILNEIAEVPLTGARWSATFDTESQSTKLSMAEPSELPSKLKITLWNSDKYDQIRTEDIIFDSDVREFALSLDGTVLAIAIESGIKLFNVGTNSTVTSLAHDIPLCGKDFSFSPDGRFLLLLMTMIDDENESSWMVYDLHSRKLSNTGLKKKYIFEWITDESFLAQPSIQDLDEPNEYYVRNAKQPWLDIEPIECKVHSDVMNDDISNFNVDELTNYGVRMVGPEHVLIGRDVFQFTFEKHSLKQ